MAKTFSTPGITRQEIDLSSILVPDGISTGGIVIRSLQGPVNRPVLVQNDKDFIDTFGPPIFTSGSTLSNYPDAKLIPEYGYGAYAALQFLQESSNLYVVRDFTTADTYATAQITPSTFIPFTIASAGISGSGFQIGNRLDSNTYISIVDNWAGYGPTNTGAGNAYLNFAALGPGTNGNNIAITIEPFSLSADWKFTYDNYPTALYNGNSIATASALPTSVITSTSAFPIGSQVFKINVYSKATTQTWDSLYINNTYRQAGQLILNPVETWYCSLNANLHDDNGNTLFIENVINGVSQYIYVKNGTNNSTSFQVISASNDPNAVLIPVGYTSAGQEYIPYISSASTGTSANRLITFNGGTSDTANTGYLSTPTNQTANGLGWNGWDIFHDRQNTTVQILIGATTDTTTKLKIASIAAFRVDCIATVQTGYLGDDTTTSIISKEAYGYQSPSYVAIYAGYSKIYDQYNDKFLYLPNSIFGASLFARTDTIANPWSAPAGVDRATMSVLDQRKVFSDSEIGTLYNANINVPKQIKGTGFVMWGQKTAQMKASALDRINVRRNLLYIENNIETALLPFVFENNTDKTRLRIFSLLDEFLSGILASGGLYAYNIVCDSTNNGSAIIDANRLNVDCYVQPVKTIEYIQLSTIITRSGVSLSEVRVSTT